MQTNDNNNNNINSGVHAAEKTAFFMRISNHKTERKEKDNSPQIKFGFFIAVR